MNEMKRFLLLLLIPLFFECSSSGHADGEYCAEVGYYNPDTGTESSYTLTVQVQDNQVIAINFPNGGSIDDEITDGSLNSSGEASFTAQNGTEYTVEITGDTGDCFDDVALAERCKGTTKKGTQCKRLTDNPSGYCYQHEDQY